MPKPVETSVESGMLTTVWTPQQELQGGRDSRKNYPYINRKADSSTRDN